tara:strand:- start:317 stop:1147 length:831 start_codon:yes stop_codon:yes gene_type:complete
MKLIMENWRGFLKEGRYEAATTELTRKVIPHVKYIIDEVIPSDGVQNSRKDLILVIGKKYQAGKGLPKELEDMMYMAEFTFHIDKKLAEETGDKFQIGGMHMSVPGEDKRDDYIKINSFLDIGFNEQDLNAYLGELKAVTIHEIQHGGQTDDMLATAFPPRIPGKIPQIRWDYNKIDGIRGYYASDSETETYAKEVYKRAKYYKIPYTEALDMRIKQFFDMFRRRRDKMNAEDEKETPGEYRVKYTEEELKDFFYNELRDKYIAFAKTKYPEAVGI